MQTSLNLCLLLLHSVANAGDLQGILKLHITIDIKQDAQKQDDCILFEFSCCKSTNFIKGVAVSILLDGILFSYFLFF